MNRFVYMSFFLWGALVYLNAISFDGPMVIKSDWNLRALEVADMDQDGDLDLIVANNDRLQVEIWEQGGVAEKKDRADRRSTVDAERWQPELSDAGFDMEKFSVGFAIYDLAVGDLNGDGFVDVAYTGEETAFTIRFQGESGTWIEQAVYEDFKALSWTRTLAVTDLDQDGRWEVIVLGSDAIRVFRDVNLSDLGEPELYYVTGVNPYNLLVVDVNGDTREDLIYLSAESGGSIRLREQQPGGGFGPELRVQIDQPVQKLHLVPGDDSESPRFVGIDAQTGGLSLLSLTSTEVADSFQAGAQPEIYPLFSKGQNSAKLETTDLNGDSVLDLIVANPESSELKVYLQGAQGFAESLSFPTFTGVEKIAEVRRGEDRMAAYVILSPSESVIGMSYLEANGRLTFPSAIELRAEDVPIAFEVLDLDGDMIDELLVVVEEGGQRALLIYQAESGAEAWELVSSVGLEGVRRKPYAIFEWPNVLEGSVVLMIAVAREAPLLLKADSSSPFEFVAFAEDSAVRKSLLKGVSPVQMNFADLSGNNLNELLVGVEGYARVVALDSGALKMVDQLNVYQGDGRVDLVLPQRAKGQVDTIDLYIGGAGELQRLKRSDDGVFRYDSKRFIGEMDVESWNLIAAPSGARSQIFNDGAAFWVLPEEGTLWAAERIAYYETDLEDTYFNIVECTDFDGNGRLDFLAVDGQENVVEVLRENDAENFESVIFWKVFEENLHYQGRKGGRVEPRQVLAADLNGDGRDDFAFLVHDRILIYVQE